MIAPLKILALSAVLLLSACAHAQPAQRDTIIVAELRSLTLTRRDWRAEDRAIDTELRRQARRHTADDDEDAIVVSNHCGESIATFRVIRATQPAPQHITQTQRIGEFCTPPFAFEDGYWVLVLNAATNTIVARYPIFWTDDGTLYAVSEFGPTDLPSNGSAEMQRLLTPTALPEAVEYIVNLEGDALTRYVASRPSFEIRQGRVWIVSAIAVEPIFPGMDLDALLP